MLAHDEAKLPLLLDALDQVLGEIAQAITRGTLAEEAGLPRVRRGFTRLA
jgi:hypothetical protein